MLFTRIITALVGIPFTIFLVWKGGILLLGAIIFIVLLATKEIINIYKMEKNYHLLFLIYIFGLIMILQTYYYSDQFLGLISFLYILLLSMAAIIRRARFEDILYGAFTYIYIPFLMRYLILLRFQEQGFYLVLTVFLLTWSSDTGAFFVGKFLGKRKLSPKISPNKTIEGAIGAIIFTITISVLVIPFLFDKSVFSSIILGILISIIGQIGDLFESFIKRNFKVKDSGDILPGHGGILDRFDSLLLTAPIMYYAFKLLI